MRGSRLLAAGLFFLAAAASHGFALADSCGGNWEVNDCAICGKSREILAKGSQAGVDQILAENGKNGCKIWKEKDNVYGCVSAGKCVQKSRKLRWSCQGNSSADCVNLSNSNFSKGDCKVQGLDCQGDGSGDGIYTCSGTSDVCMSPIPDDSFLGIATSTCPEGTERFKYSYNPMLGRDVFQRFANNSYCKWKTNQ